MHKDKINAEAIRLHGIYKGKIQTRLKVPVRTFEDFSYWYSPGVAAPCLEIQDDIEKSYDYTNRGNTIAVITNGTRVLGLGDIGPEASMPVMEGKALLFKYLGGVDAFPIALKTKDKRQFIETVKLLEPSFGGINLEDISQPDCFDILDELRETMNIPVWHDDQQGTALVIVAAFLNALKVANKKTQDIKVTLLGAGAANINIARLLIRSGVNPENMVLADSRGIITRTNREADKEKYRQKWELAGITNRENIDGDIINAFKGADAVIALSVSKPGTILKDHIHVMSKKPIVFACANPLPEIWPEDAKDAGAFIVATGRADYPNQVNNSLGFPGLFRGILDVRASKITDDICLKVANAIALFQEKRGIDQEHIVPCMQDAEMYEFEAFEAASQAIKEGLNRISLDEKSLKEKIKKNLASGRLPALH